MAQINNLRINNILYEIGGSGSGPELLWENPSPSASFAGQTITLADDVGNYDYIGIICANGTGTDGRKRFLPMVLIPTKTTMGADITFAGYRNYIRTASSISGNKVTFTDSEYYANYGTNTKTSYNTSLIPRYVIGFK